MIRKWFCNTFEFVVTIAFVLSAFGVVIFAILAGATAMSYPYNFGAFGSLLVVLTTLIGGAISLFLTFGLVYVVLDIRSSMIRLVELNEKR